MIKFILFFLFLPFHLEAESSNPTNTEAGFNLDTGKDVCCDRSPKFESAHDLSEEESRRRVLQTLYSTTEPKPKKSERGQR